MPSTALTKAALKKLQGGSSEDDKEDRSALRDAIREAFDAVKGDNFDAFAEAFGNAITIRLSEEE